MLRHKGKRRTLVHNLRLAGVLSFIAGLVNITGILSVQILTTNITGHFAFFSEELVLSHYIIAIVYLLFIVFYFLGAFIANILIETIAKVKPVMSHAIPLFIEAILLAIVGVYGISDYSSEVSKWCIASSLLFAMGIQNSSVTHISDSKVRTTHLTGLFTDLGIEFSQLFFYKQPTERKTLFKSISIKLIIILFFFFGGVAGGFLYHFLNLRTLLVASGCLLIILFYDGIRLNYYLLKRRRLKF